jgi:hypothetical protein
VHIQQDVSRIPYNRWKLHQQEDCPATDLEGIAGRIKSPFSLEYRLVQRPITIDSNYDERADGPYINSLVMDGHLKFGRDDDILYANGSRGIQFNFDMDSSVIVGYEICSLFCALMEENCIYGGVPVVLPLLSPSIATISRIDQPAWVQSKRIFGTITSFLPFELQAGGLRLVCRQFNETNRNETSR